MGDYLRLKFRVRIVGDYTVTRFFNFKIKYLHKNEKVCETVLTCSCGPGARYRVF